jgi:uncharacterized protein (UPF0276 family)
MRFAINYSPQAADLVTRCVIDVDLFKCPTASDPVVIENAPTLLDDARRVRPIYIHFPLETAAGALDDVDWKEIDGALDTTETRYVNVHLHASAEAFPEIAPESTEPADLRMITDAFINGVGVLVERYGPERVIAENVVYVGPEGKFLRAGIEPSVISRVIRETGCGLLLDIAHARITCDELRVSPREYLSELPIDSLRELHVTGTGTGERLRDSMPMNDGDWALYEWVRARVDGGDWPAPWAVAFEYGGIGPLFDWRSEPKVIAAAWPRLRS